METSKFRQLISQQRVFIDTNIFIYALEDNQNFPLAPELFRMLKESKVIVYTSVITLIELTTKLFKDKRREKVSDYIEFLHGGGLITVSGIDQQIALMAAELRATGLETPDAIQLAVALEHNCSLFITADKKFKAPPATRLRVVTI